MADLSDRGRRRPRRRGGRKERGPEKGEIPSAGPPLTKPPIILAKPPTDRDKDRSTQSPPPMMVARSPVADRSSEDRDRPAPPKTLIMLKPRPSGDDTSRSMTSSMATSPSIPSILASDGLTQPSYQIQRNPAVTPSTPSGSEAPIQLKTEINAAKKSHVQMLRKAKRLAPVSCGSASRLAPAPDMPCGSKLVDEAFIWCDNPMEMLLDQTDFLTVGVLGPQGAGKSTLLSLIAGNNPTDPHKSFVLRPQSKDIREVGAHQTIGIDMFVTAERIMLLDTQAMLSASILDHMIHHEKKLSAEYSSAENCLQMQSLMVATFLMTVCNVVLVVMDWFADFDFLRLVQTAEMLKPATPGPGHDGASADESPEHFPHIVFVLNKATRDDFSPENYEAMREALQGVFSTAKSKYRGGVSLAATGALPGVSVPNPLTDLNLFLLPDLHASSGNSSNQGHEGVLSLLPTFASHPSPEHLIRVLRNQLLAVPRGMLTHATLSERNWFHYAARTWEAIKKSPLMVEYNRLLP